MSAETETLDRLVERLGPMLAPMLGDLVEREVTLRVGQLELRRQSVRQIRDDKILSACERVATAVDELEQARLCGAAEIPARQKLTRAAGQLRTVMRGRPK